jgi:hypothetical protein
VLAPQVGETVPWQLLVVQVEYTAEPGTMLLPFVTYVVPEACAPVKERLITLFEWIARAVPLTVVLV